MRGPVVLLLVFPGAARRMPEPIQRLPGDLFVPGLELPPKSMQPAEQAVHRDTLLTIATRRCLPRTTASAPRPLAARS